MDIVFARIFKIFLLSLAFAPSGSKFIDLTYPLNKMTPLFPGMETSFNVEFEGITPGGFFVASKGFCVSEHTGTHLDTPYHMYKHGIRLDSIPLENLINVSGVCIDITDKVHSFENGNIVIKENYMLTPQDITEWEAAHGKIPHNSVVLLRTGWNKRYNDQKLYLGFKDSSQSPPDNMTGVDWNYASHFPGYSKEAAEYLSNERQILGAGIDAMSIDMGSSRELYAHRAFMAKGKYLLENVANLDLIPPMGFRLWIMPFKIDRATGAPTRVLAELD